MKSNYEFRGELFNRKFPEKQYPIIDFSCLTKGAGKGRSKFNDGPIVHIDDLNFSIFEFLYQLDDVSPSRSKIEEWVLTNTSFKDASGIYYINTGLRRAILTTKSVSSSIAKVLHELIHATNESDLFLKRTARSQTLAFQVIKYERSYSTASTYAGLYNVMVPSALLSENTPNYRSHPGYRNGLKLGGNWQTLLIEELLDEGIRPDGFVSSRELKLWRDKTYKAKKVISPEEFKSLLIKKIDENS